MIPKKHASKLKNTTTTTTTASLFFRVLFLACVAAHKANAYRYYGISLLVPINVLVFFDIFLSIILQKCDDDVHRPANRRLRSASRGGRATRGRRATRTMGKETAPRKRRTIHPERRLPIDARYVFFFYPTFFSWIIKCSLFFSWKNI